MMVTAGEVAPDPDAPSVLDGSLLEELLAHTADVVFLIDASSGTALRRWHDPDHSRLPLAPAPTDRVINRVHPDDIADVLDVVARTAIVGGTGSTVVRIHPDLRAELGDGLLVSVHDVGHLVDHGLLLQAWLVAPDMFGTHHADAGTAMSSLAAAAPVGLQVRSGNGTVSFENERFTTLSGPVRQRVDRLVDAAIASPEEEIVDLDEDGCSLRLRIVPTFDDDGDQLLLAVASLEDVTSLRRAEEGRAAAEGMFRAVFDGSPVATAIIDLDGRFVEVNESFSVICGYSAEELIGRSSAAITHPDDVPLDEGMTAELVAGQRSSYQLEKRYRHAAGHEIWVDLTVAGVRGPDGTVRHFVSHADDITGRKTSLGESESRDDLAHWATHDHLTGLANRRYLENFLDVSFGARRRADDRFAVLFLDLDDFKPVNDVHGHHVGDEVLRTIARRLRNTCRNDMLVARYGGDEFVVVTRGLRTAQEVSLLVERILSAIRTPIEGMASTTIRVGASVGVATAHEGETPEAVLRRADAASYRAKRRQKEHDVMSGGPA